MKIGKQQDVRDCGLVVLQSFINYFYSTWVDIDYLKMKASYGTNGITLKNLEDIAKKNNLLFDACEGDFKTLSQLENKELPIMILILENGIYHYVILYKKHKNKVCLLDPAQGERIISSDYLKQIYQNVAVFISKNNENNNTNKSHLENKIGSIFNAKSYTLSLIFSAIFATFLGFVSTFFIKIIFDYVLPNQQVKLAILLFIAFLWVNIIRFINDFFRGFVIKKSQNSIELDLNKQYYSKIKNAKYKCLSKLNNADLLRRSAYIESIANYQATFTFAILSEIFTLVLSTIVLLLISYWLFIIVLTVSLFSLLINFLYQSNINQKFQKFIVAGLKKEMSNLDFVLSHKELKNQDYANFISSQQTKNNFAFKDREYQIFSTNARKNFLTSVFNNNLSLILVFVSSILIMKNKLSPGTTMMFLTGVSFFITPLNTIVDLFLKFNIVKSQMKLLNFVLNFEEDNINKNGLQISKLESIKIQDLTFNYEKHKDIIDIGYYEVNDNLQLKGNNGCGKSTFLNLISLNLEPESGAIKLNNINSKNVDLLDFKNKIFYSNPGIYLPETTIFDYVCLQNKDLIKNFQENIQKYNLNLIINKMKIDLYENITNNGANFSSGQRQLIMLLRLFTKKFNLILLDEAFENLDAESTQIIFEAIKKFQDQALFIEISHSKKFIWNNKEVNFEQINQIK